MESPSGLGTTAQNHHHPPHLRPAGLVAVTVSIVQSYYVWKICCNHMNKALGRAQGLIFAIMGDPGINFL